MTAPRDTFGRPIVVVTGMGIVTSLGAGKADNWKKLTAGESGIRTVTRFPIDGLKSTMAGTVDFVTVEPSSSTAPDRAARRHRHRGSARAVRHRPQGRFSGTAVPRGGAGRGRMAAADRSRTRGRQAGLQRRRCAGDQRRRKIRAVSSSFHVRLGGRTSGREIRHQGIADFAVDRLRVGRHRDPARRRSHSPRRNRCGAVRRRPMARSIRKP